MPPKQNKARTKAQWSETSLKLAFQLVKDGKKIREAARSTGIPFSTLQERLKNNNSDIPQLGRNTIFTKEQEDDMASRIKLLAIIFYGCTAMEIRKMAFEFAERNGIVHNFNRNYKTAGKDWLDGFLKRNSLSVRKAEGTSLNRAAAFNREEVTLFFKLLGNLMEKHKFPPRNIYNVDETGVTSVQDPGKVVAQKGQKRVGSITSGERGQNVTAVCAMSATGQFIPPMFIYPRQRHSTALERDGPREAGYKCSKNGWINEELFVEWLRHFVKFAKPTEIDPVLLILDNHSSHISWSAFTFCKENNIVMLSLPPHGSHRIQPMDVSVYGPFKSAYKQECNIFMKTDLGRKITQNDIASLFRKSFQRVATIPKAEAGFAASGIYPYNPNIFTDEDFLPSEYLNNSELAYDEERLDHINRTPESPSLLVEANPQIPLLNVDCDNPARSTAGISAVVLSNEMPASAIPTQNCANPDPSPADISYVELRNVSPLPAPVIQQHNLDSDNPDPSNNDIYVTLPPGPEILEPLTSSISSVKYIDYNNPIPSASGSGISNTKFYSEIVDIYVTSPPGLEILEPLTSSISSVKYIDYNNPIPSTSGSGISSTKFYSEIVTAKDLLPVPKTLGKKKPQASRKQHATVITGTPNKIILFQKEQKKMAKLIKAEIKIENQKNKSAQVKEKVTGTTKKKTVKKEKETKATQVKRLKKKVESSHDYNTATVETKRTDLFDDDETDIGDDLENKIGNQRKKTLLVKTFEKEVNRKAAEVNRVKRKVLQDENMNNDMRGKKPKPTGKRRVKKKVVQDKSTDDDLTSNSETDMTDLREDDDTDLDDNIFNKCIICDDYGRDNELWYRCVRCGRWAHSECSGYDSADDYICELCV